MEREILILQLIQQPLCAIEINADVMLKATGVEGVYTDDPMKNVSAKLYKKLTYMDVLGQRLGLWI